MTCTHSMFNWFLWRPSKPVIQGLEDPRRLSTQGGKRGRQVRVLLGFGAEHVKFVAMAAPPSAAQAKELLRALLREGRKFSNYNVREYVKRRTIEGFQENRNVTDPAVLGAAYADGLKQLEIAKRQSIVYNLYAPQVKSIMDLKITKPSHA